MKKSGIVASCRNLREGPFVLMLALAMVLLPLSAVHGASKTYLQHNLVSNGTLEADHIDPQLVNAWGIAFNPNAFVWVADNRIGVATLYDGSGVKQPLVVTIPSPVGGGASTPTGIVYNGTPDFTVTRGETSGTAIFIFATEDGTISAWVPSVDPTNAIRVVSNSSSGTVYKGLVLAANGTGNFLYATDFHNGKIDVFDRDFKFVVTSGTFKDPDVPDGYAPFGIRNLDGNLYVTYAMQDEARHDDVPGKGHGYVRIFDTDGNLIRRIASPGKLNSPWGVAIAPADFGTFSNRLLVGNSGDGTINAFDVASGKPLGQLRNHVGGVIKIEGLRGLSFGNGVENQPTNVLFFTAGPDNENSGLYGFIEPE